MGEAYILLLVILGLGVMAKNASVVIAVGIVLIMKIAGLKSILRFSDEKGVEIGLAIMMIALIAPIASGDFGLDKFIRFLHEPIGILAVLVGISATLFARQGVELMAGSPIVVPMAIAGIIIGVVAFKGVPVGPLVASGLTAALYGVLRFFIR